jgi:hypothetical protein
MLCNREAEKDLPDEDLKEAKKDLPDRGPERPERACQTKT